MRNIFSLSFLLVMLLTFTSCKRDWAKEMLTGNSFRYWKYTYGPLSKDDSISLQEGYHLYRDPFFLYFDRHGTYVEYEGDDIRTVKEQVFDRQCMEDEFYQTWEMSSDSTMLWINDRLLFVKIIAPDEMLVYGQSIDDRVDTLRVVKREDIPDRLRMYYFRRKKQNIIGSGGKDMEIQKESMENDQYEKFLDSESLIPIIPKKRK